MTELMKEYELIIIGGGSAGLAAALSARENGCGEILILERDVELGGILQQCIHNGFGLHTFKEELTGPEYAQRYIDMILEKNISYRTDTMVLHVSGEKEVTYVNPTEGMVQVRAKAVILAMGCRERTRGALAIPGYRPAGIWTAGTAQRYLNMEGFLVGKRVVILGSGDIGLIMARRMTLEGAKVLAVAEIMPYSNGLARNIRQCLEDYQIPLYLSHTVTQINGKDRVTSIEISQVDDHFQVQEGTQKRFEADTLLLSVGLIPENGLSEEAGILIHDKTRGPIVDQNYETSVEGIFACGNVLHVHDLVDYVSMEGKKAGKNAAEYIKKEQRTKEKGTKGKIPVQAGEGIGYVLPQFLYKEELEEKTEFLFRVTKPSKNSSISILKDGVLWKEIQKKNLAPAEMEKIVISKKDLENIKGQLVFKVTGKER